MTEIWEKKNNQGNIGKSNQKIHWEWLLNMDAIKRKPKDMRAKCPVFDFGQEGNKIFLQRC